MLSSMTSVGDIFPYKIFLEHLAYFKSHHFKKLKPVKMVTFWEDIGKMWTTFYSNIWCTTQVWTVMAKNVLRCLC